MYIRLLRCGCGGGGGGSSTATDGYIAYSAPVIPTECGLTRTVLNTWMTALICIKLQDKFEKAGINVVSVNQLLGLLQSALNYPDNYCYFYEQLQYFQQSLLPSIITNVPECFS